MFPSSNVDPVYYSDQQGYHSRSFFNDLITCNSKHEEHQPPFSFFHLPSSPLMNPNCYDQLSLHDHDHDFFQTHELLLHQQPFNTVESQKNYQPNSKDQQIPRKRSSKRDRHSKINTAQGPRDRRMRLSLKVAREFFALQDKLCFDKASKTVEWLLVQARPAIKRLCGGTGTNYSASSTSECEVVSGIDEEGAAIKGSCVSKPKSSSSVSNNKAKRAKPSRKITFHPQAREWREKARARARERTREKEWSRRRIDIESSELCEKEANKSHDFNQFRGWSPFQTIVNNPNSMGIITEVSTESLIDESMVIMGKLSPSSILNHLCTSGFPQERQITDFQSFYKPWEAFNS